MLPKRVYRLVIKKPKGWTRQVSHNQRPTDLISGTSKRGFTMIGEALKAKNDLEKRNPGITVQVYEAECKWKPCTRVHGEEDQTVLV